MFRSPQRGQEEYLGTHHDSRRRINPRQNPNSKIPTSPKEEDQSGA